MNMPNIPPQLHAHHACTARIRVQAFHKRITFCLDVHNEAVRAMRYPPNAYKKELESARLGLDDKTEEELAKEIEDEMDEDGL